MEKFDTILDNTINSMIEVEFHHNCRGKLYEFAWARLDTPKCKSIKRKVDRIAKKMNLKTSIFSVYGTSSDWKTMQELRIRIMDEMNLFVSPVTWVPIEDYGLNFFIFAYFPAFDRCEFKFDDNITELPDKINDMPLSIDNLFYMESLRMKLMEDDNNTFQAPFVAMSDNDRTPVVCCSSRMNQFRKFYELTDDSVYTNDMSSEVFAETVIRDFEMEDEYIPELKLIVSYNPDKAAKLYTMLSSRLNTSWIINVNTYKSDKCVITFSFDDTRYDRTARHHSIFYIQNNLIWNI